MIAIARRGVGHEERVDISDRALPVRTDETLVQERHIVSSAVFTDDALEVSRVLRVHGRALDEQPDRACIMSRAIRLEEVLQPLLPAILTKETNHQRLILVKRARRARLPVNIARHESRRVDTADILCRPPEKILA